MTDIIGQSFGRYQITELLGEGGMATVYKAYDTRLEREVAIKVIRTERLTIENTPKALARFERETKTLAKLTHPNIVSVSDYGEYEGKPYLVMPCLTGGTLKAKLGKPVPWQAAVHLLLPVARALDYAHRRGFIHRDVKPSNILFTDSGEPMLTDFGIAKMLESEDAQTLTGTGLGVGTPEYMAPEQGLAKEIDARADVYSLGIVLYELITGRKPFLADATDTPMAVILKHTTVSLPRPRTFVPSLPEQVEKVLVKALEKKPQDRYENMQCFGEALERLLANKVKPEPETVRKQFSEPELKKQVAHPAKREAAKAAGSPAALTEKATQPRAAKKGFSRKPAIWILSAIGIITLAGLGVYSGLLGENLPASLFPTDTPTVTLTTTKTPTRTPTTTLTPTPTNTATPWGMGQTFVRKADEMVMLYVPAGSFSMGSTNGALDEQPVHVVNLDAFWIDKTEVTNAMYLKCVRAGKCQRPDKTSSTRSSYWNNPQYNDFPVIDAFWDDAVAYCTWAGARLPTEAEWEKAARGIDGRTYPWGEEIDCSRANYSDRDGRCTGDTTKVGSYPSGASPYGALDMAGNVAEWVADYYGATYYTDSPAANPLGPTELENYIHFGQRNVRGGSWLGEWSDLRSANRTSSNALPYRVRYLGIRCARSE